MTISLRTILLAALATLAVANPLPQPDVDGTMTLERRQSMTSNDLEDGKCADVAFIFARGSTETGNMGFVVGPGVCSNLKKDIGSDKVLCQGVGGAYTAGLVQNFLPENTDSGSIGAAVDMFELAGKCPDMQIVAGGYSQGTAVIAGAIQKLDDSLRERVKGVALFGYTRNLQDGGKIPGYPEDQTKVYCAVGDMVCTGTLIITAAHMTYGIDAGSAAKFLAGQVGSV
ncbi:cutinase-domain-containing protein [Aspergillus stella-maris]|uniref:cutinase-domain-containing protein n=1 Tax=Aspergillus stella-maris TaxID=1810926 RepID=UPI003CCD7755